MRAARKPILLIQFCFVVFVVLFYTVPSWSNLPATIDGLRARYGLWFPILSVWFVSIVVPEIAQVLTKSRVRPITFGEVAGKLVYFALIGLCLEFLYAWLDSILGSKLTFGVVVLKVLFDMLVFSPLLSMPLATLTFLLIDCGYSMPMVREKLAQGEFWKRFFPTLVTCWMYFGPVVIAMYSLPKALNYPVAMAANAAWGLIVTSLGSRAVE